MTAIPAIYQSYKIMPFLQLHQLRVAAVAQLICNHLTVQVDSAYVIEACLLHDMGNILKFDLSAFPNSVEPEGRKYWENVKRKTAERYGTKDEHAATLMMAREIGTSATVIDYIDAIGFSHAIEVEQNQSYEKKICCYADMRVAPMGVLSLAGRIKDGRDRYRSRKGYNGSEDWFDEIYGAYQRVEQDIFNRSDITAAEITEKAIQSLIPALKQTILKQP